MRNYTAQIIQLFAPRQKRGKKINSNGEFNSPKLGELSLPSGTAENFRLRQDRYYDWRQAAAVMDYCAP